MGPSNWTVTHRGHKQYLLSQVTYSHKILSSLKPTEFVISYSPMSNIQRCSKVGKIPCQSCFQVQKHRLQLYHVSLAHRSKIKFTLPQMPAPSKTQWHKNRLSEICSYKECTDTKDQTKRTHIFKGTISNLIQLRSKVYLDVDLKVLNTLSC